MHAIGTDIVEIARLEHWPDDPEMLSFIFTDSERNAAMKWKFPHKFLAVVFAIKESFLKAAGTGWGDGVRWKDIEVAKEAKGWAMQLYNKAGQVCGARRLIVSATCSRDFAAAVVMIE